MADTGERLIYFFRQQTYAINEYIKKEIVDKIWYNPNIKRRNNNEKADSICFSHRINV